MAAAKGGFIMAHFRVKKAKGFLLALVSVSLLLSIFSKMEKTECVEVETEQRDVLKKKTERKYKEDILSISYQAPSKLLTAFTNLDPTSHFGVGNHENVVLGPPVITSLLYTVVEGTRGETQNQISNFFGFNDAVEKRKENQTFVTEDDGEGDEPTADGSQSASSTSRRSSSSYSSSYSSYSSSYSQYSGWQQGAGGSAVRPKLTSVFKTFSVPPPDALQDATLNFAAAVYADESIGRTALFENFTANLNQKLDAKMTVVDFVSKKSEAIDQINDFVREKTNGKIPWIVSDSSVDDATRLVLTSAMYFKGKWAQEFEKTNTAPAPFYAIQRNSVEPLIDVVETVDDVQFMNGNFTVDPSSDRHMYVYYDPDTKMNVLELPYKQKGLSMAFFYPDDAKELYTFTQVTMKQNPNIPNELLNKARAGKGTGKFEISVPKFKFEELYQRNLEWPLHHVGITAMFSPERADFSGICEDKVFVSKFLTKATIEVSEEGTVASASAAMSVSLTSMLPDEFEVVQSARVNKSFIYQLRWSEHPQNSTDEQYGGVHTAENDVVLFEGQVRNPKPLQGDFKQIDWRL